MTAFAALKPKTYRYWQMVVVKKKKAKGTKTCHKKRKLKFEDYKYCLEATQVKSKIKQLVKIALM